MNVQQIKYEIQHIISGKSSASYDALIQTIAGYLRRGTKASPMAQKKHQYKAQETKDLIEFARSNNILIDTIPLHDFVSSGAEQKVYIKDTAHVVKLNDCVYYVSWEDYFYSLLLHNYFFTDTAYEFKGFYLLDDVLHAVVQQPYVKAN
ncbi:hypothetical protein GCM10009117_01010 [Gangjinia marincola]|uniref:Uncharacterized protein n=1 Tax=Gangjinia marincola TaxID=578463 RepID=A0ABN1MCY1_9FLAO